MTNLHHSTFKDHSNEEYKSNMLEKCNGVHSNDREFRAFTPLRLLSTKVN